MGYRADDAGVMLRRALVGVLVAGLIASLGLVGGVLLSAVGPADRLPQALAECPDGGQPPCVTATNTEPPETEDPDPDDPGPTGPPLPPPYEEVWVIACSVNTPDNPGDVMCMGAVNCPEDDEIRYRIYRRYLESVGPPPEYGSWEFQVSDCFNREEEENPPPQVTPGMILEEIRGGLVPAREVQSQPVDGRTAVNFDTIFYTEPATFADTIPFFGGQIVVEVRGEPVGYTWVYGDGETDDTTDPGAPYPDQTVVHQYLRKGAFDARVDVTYGNFEYRAPGQDWQPLPGTAVAEGTPSTITVLELSSVLGN